MPGNSPGSVEGRAEAAGGIGADEISAAVATVNASGGGGGTLQAGAPAVAGGLPYAILKQTHPSYDGSYWAETRALYEGGKALLRNEGLLCTLFPKHRDELSQVYGERKRRAFYVPYAAEIIDHLVAGVSSDPIHVHVGSDPEKSKALPDFYQGFVEDVSPDGGAKVPLTEILADQLREALQTCWTWVLVDLPVAKGYRTAADQEKAGALRAYAVPLDPECVVDWEEDSVGNLLWVLVHVVESRRESLTQSRSIIRERWTVYTGDDWQRYERERKADKEFDDKDIIPLTDGGRHSFERVPVIRFQLPRGLWAMNKLHGIAVEHFNKRSALSWGETQSLLPELYEFQGPEDGSRGAPIGQAQEDPGRATNQRRGQGYVQLRGKDDEAKFIGPDTAPFSEARQSCDGLRDDMHRVMHQMALSAANNASALKRSAESKEQDKASVEVVLADLGARLRKHAQAIMSMVSRGRRDAALVDEWVAKGAAEFDSIAVSDSLKNALDIDMLKIESKTFRQVHRKLITRDVLQGKVSSEEQEQIDRELEENITDESIAPANDLVPGEEDLGSARPGAGFKAKGGRTGPPGTP